MATAYNGRRNQTLIYLHVLLVHTEGCGSGEINLIVNDGSVTAETKKVASNLFVAEFTPVNDAPYNVQLTYNSVPLKGQYLRLLVTQQW